MVFFARSEINLGDIKINPRIFNKLYCDKAKRTIAYYCLNDFYTCPLGHLPEATFYMLNVVVSITYTLNSLSIHLALILRCYPTPQKMF